MSIPKFTKLVTTAVPLPIENVDTDQIIPARFLKAVERKGFGDNLFRDWRYDKAGKVRSRCFVGQACKLGHNYSASDSLFFSNCQDAEAYIRAVWKISSA